MSAKLKQSGKGDAAVPAGARSRAGAGRICDMLALVLIAAAVVTGCQTGNRHASTPAEAGYVTENEAILISRELDKPRYAGIVSAIEYHPGSYPIRARAAHGGFDDSLLKDYLDNLERAGVLAREGKVNPVLVYEELGFELEKAWCNDDVRSYIDEAKKTGGPASAATAGYGAFEEIAGYCFRKDNKNCSDMDREPLLQQQ